MNRKEKSIIINNLADNFKEYTCFYIIDATKISVEAINQFRRNCRQADIIYQVAKNTLILKALTEVSEKNTYESLSENALKGFSGILFSKGAANLPAKLIKEFKKQQNLDRPILKGAYIDGEIFFGNENLEILSQLKSKSVLIAELISSLQSPMNNLLSALQSGKNKLSGIIKTLSDKEA